MLTDRIKTKLTDMLIENRSSLKHWTTATPKDYPAVIHRQSGMIKKLTEDVACLEKLLGYSQKEGDNSNIAHACSTFNLELRETVDGEVTFGRGEWDMIPFWKDENILEDWLDNDQNWNALEAMAK